MASPSRNRPTRGRRGRQSKDRKSNRDLIQPGGYVVAECISPQRKRQKSNSKDSFETPSKNNDQQNEEAEASAFPAPCVVRVRGKGTTENTNSSVKSVMDVRRLAAKDHVKDDVRMDVESVLSLVEGNRSISSITSAIVDAAMAKIEGGFNGLAEKDIYSVFDDEMLLFDNTDSFDLDRAVKSTLRLSKLNDKAFQGTSEARMYPLFRDFVMLVAFHVQSHMNSLSAKQRTGVVKANPHLILPYSRGDFKPEGSDDRTKIDGALALCKLSTHVGLQDAPKYKDVFAIQELKRSKRDSQEALIQLVEYTRNIYANQDHRRFAWGLAMCGTDVRCCLFHHDGVRVSPAMDFADIDGIRRLVTLLVNWSFCSLDRLGYDTTMERIRASNGWQISCPSHNDKSKRNSFTQYVTTGTIMNASALFGRHTRCYLAKRKDGRSNESVVIKDSWSLPLDLKKSGKQGSVVPDEAHNLRLITEKLSGKDVGFSYPRAISSGSVKFKDGSKYVTDDTSVIYGYDDGDKEHMYRVHRRIVITPVGHFIKSVRNEAELVFVLADAMECHDAILTECGLLHRDISVNNILVIRNEGKSPHRRPVRGLLIDFDHAISVDQQVSGNGARSGTLPFMSIHNLEGARGKRTALDDWESLLYLICWLATFGINSDDRDGMDDEIVEEIDKWRYADMSTIARAKRNHMDSFANFNRLVLSGFQGKYEILKVLAIDIYNALFQHKGCEGAFHGERETATASNKYDIAINKIVKNMQGIQSHNSQPGSDPLISRDNYKPQILANLLEATRDAAKACEKLLDIISKEDDKENASN
ncbi:hypothetical protein H4217_007582 [Coemansia sp. RSA 1939]|nr:hypothetical protein H4217_007582 [Coemansia sp. RSA 1939]